MSTLQVHILAGPQAGTRLKLNQSPVGFGRSAENALIIDAPVVSRQHGELAIDDKGQWVLINLSSNGTTVGRKKAKKKPIPLTDGVSITIGDTEVFRVYLTEPAATQAPAPAAVAEQTPAQPDHAPGAGAKGKSKLWIGIGLWIVFLAGISIFFVTSDRGGDEPQQTGGIWIPGNEITDLDGPAAGYQSVMNHLRVPMPWQDPNDLNYNSHLTDARAAADAGKSALYEAYIHYQQAISYSSTQDKTNPADSLTATDDKIKYNRVLDDLSIVIYDNYILAYRLYNQGNYAGARSVLDDLRKFYYRGEHRDDDELANHIRRLRNAAHARAGG